ncbi:P-loop containing nucleoside triphosphate hydrolase protein, partial [Polychytrium aggregatum]|uniref:P-loop containing nucleoside triphosphate hydrolase protein n=1 Tax=Polychytrium aggregatum TaxID=110093 RepID=UPI0022FEE70A
EDPSSKVAPPHHSMNPLQKGFYSHMTFLFSHGAKNTLSLKNFAPIEPSDDCNATSERLLREWEREAKKPSPKLWKVMMRVMWIGYRQSVFLVFVSCLLKVGTALLLGQLLVWFQDIGTSPAYMGYVWVILLSLGSVLSQIVSHWIIFATTRTGMNLRISFIATMYRKCLNLSIGHTSSTGVIVNMISADVQRLEDTCIYAIYLILAPFEFALVLYCLWEQIGVSSLAGMLGLALLVPLQSQFGKMFGAIRRETNKFRDKRISSLSDLLSGIQVIKLYAWERPFIDNVNDLRSHEVHQMTKSSLLRAINDSIYFVSPTLIALLAFGTTYALGEALTPAKIFTSIPLFNIIRMDMTNYIPKAVQFATEARVSLQRIQEFLSLPEIDRLASHSADVAHLDSVDPKLAVLVSDASLAWGTTPLGGRKAPPKSPSKTATPVPSLEKKEDVCILNSISFQANTGELVGIVGPVGAGKTSLLNALLGEMEIRAGTIHTRSRKMAYASQQPWILSGTIRDNILFGAPYREQWFRTVVKACALEHDLGRFPEGEETVVGERGVTLSGGQRARIALARAVYADADIIFLDDPLSAVDARVGRHLFNECIRGVLKGKTIFLATHQLQFVSHCDRVILLERGRVAGFGSYREVCQAPDSVFAKVLQDFEAAASNIQQTAAQDQGASAADEVLVIEDEVPEMNFQKKELAAEQSEQGTLSTQVYVDYFRTGGGVSWTVVCIVLVVLAQVCSLMTDWWLSRWSSETFTDQRNPQNLYIYVGLAGCVLVLALSRALLFYWICLNASRGLFKKMLNAVLRAPMTFFQNNPHGRIMNRFAKDINLMDDNLPMTFFDFTQFAFIILGTLGVTGTIPYLLLFIPPIVYGFVRIQRFYLLTARQIKRMENVSRSPVYSFITTSLDGLALVRAYGRQSMFLNEFIKLQNDNTRLFFAYLSSGRWLGIRLDMSASAFIFVLGLLCVVLKSSLGLSGGTVGLILSYALQLAGCSQWTIRQSTEVENLMISCERILEYTRLAPEAAEYTHVRPEKGWPSKGNVAMKDMTLRYPGSSWDALKAISVDIQGGTKIGVVGRTGAGKSSIIQALFRLVEPTPENSIMVDGVSTSALGLADLRSSISIIPQEPFCFNGTVRFNLDPFNKYTDAEIWSALELVSLKTRVGSDLETHISENGSNWSFGERQLICLARALLRASKIIVMDEATSAVDMQTDRLIQDSVRTIFKDSTVFTIAHRLNTIIDYDRILVLDEGRVVEYGSPRELLAIEGHGWFWKMCKETGEQSFELLKRAASERGQ